MRYVALPGSGLTVSKLGLGTWLFGGRRWGRVDGLESARTIEAAIESGITLFDTADAYGVGQAELLLGEALKGFRKDVVIASKVGVVWRDDGSRYVDLSPSHIKRAISLSLKRLQTDFIDVYQLHEMDPSTPISETGRALIGLQREGVIRHIGVSNFDVNTLSELTTIVPVLTTQSEYSLCRRAIERDLLPYCQSHRVSVLAHSPLCRGMLSGKFNEASVFPETDNRFHDEEFQGDRFRGNLERVAKLAEIAGELDCSPAALAIRWVMDSPSVDTVICGARTPSQLEDNLSALECGLSPDVMRRVSDLFSPREDEC
jgi:aryl-alcohol dehydrogenase-like predicted oxidoreductase